MDSLIHDHPDSGDAVVASQRRLASLVHPLSPQEFITEKWPGTFHHFSGEASRLAELIDQPELRDIESLVHCPLRGSIRADYTRERRSSETDISPERALELYRAACTIYLSRLATDPIRRWSRALDDAFGLIPGTTQVNAFASTAGTGLSWHWDPQEVFIVQVRGCKRWHVAPNDYIAWPTTSGQAGAENRAEIRYQLRDPEARVESPAQWSTIDLEPGSVLFMPRGYWHTTENIDESIHLVLQMKTPCWRDVFEFLFQSVPDLYGLDWRRPTQALHPQRLLSDGVREFQDRCDQLLLYASAERMAELARLFDKSRS